MVGGDCGPTFFRRLFLHEKRGLVFTVFWGHLEGVGTFNPHPPTQATSRCPPLLGLKSQQSTYQGFLLTLLPRIKQYLS